MINKNKIASETEFKLLDWPCWRFETSRSVY